MQKLTLTRATEEDCRFLYDLRNEEDVRKNSFQTETFSYESHVAWYKEKLGDKQTQIYVLKQDGENIGQARGWRNFLCALPKGKRIWIC